MVDPEVAAAVASNYLNMFGIVAVAYMWARMAEKALSEESKFNMTKLKMARYYHNQILPEIDSIRKSSKRARPHDGIRAGRILSQTMAMIASKCGLPVWWWR